MADNGRITVRISDAFSFLNDPQYNSDVHPSTLSSTTPKPLRDTKQEENQCKNLPTIGHHAEKFINKQSTCSDDYTIITYLEPEPCFNPVQYSGSSSLALHTCNNSLHELGSSHRGDFRDNVDSEDSFTIHTSIEEESDSSLAASWTHQVDSQVDTCSENCVRNVYTHTSQPEGSGALDPNTCTMFTNTECNIDKSLSTISSNDRVTSQCKNDYLYKQVVGQSQQIKSDTSNELVDEAVHLRSPSELSPDGKHRRTQQIVSDAFRFLQTMSDGAMDDTQVTDEDKCIDDIAETTELGNSVKNLTIDSDTCNALSASEPGCDLKVNKENRFCMDIDDGNRHELLERDKDEVSTNEVNSVVVKRERLRSRKKTIEDDDNSECSSDDDKGIYSESYRKSCWIQMDSGRHALLIQNHDLSSMDQGNSVDGELESGLESQAQGDEEDKAENDEVFNGDLAALRSSNHRRTESNATTKSEKEYMRSFKARRKFIVNRQNSQHEYQRMSMKIYEHEKMVTLDRPSDNTDLGLHILDSHPAVISSVDPGSVAEKAGIEEGQILLSVNNTNVLQASHAEIISLFLQKKGQVILEVAESNHHVVRDLQSTVLCGYMLKMSANTFLRFWKKRYFVLRKDNCLYYYKNEEDLSDPLGAVPMIGYTVTPHIDHAREHCFKAEKFGAKTCFFSVESRDDMTNWVFALNEAAMKARKRKESWMNITSHNVGLPALEIRQPECSGYLSKSNKSMKNWKKRYCLLKDACIYYYKSIHSSAAQGMAHFHGYRVDITGIPNHKFSFVLKPPESQMRTFYFCAENECDKIRWVNALELSIQRWVKVD